MRIRVIGAGRVGAPLGAWLLAKNHKVSFVDTNEELLENVLNGTLDWEEPYLNETLQDEQDNMILSPEEDCDWTFICVGTPVSNGIPVLDHIDKIIEGIPKSTNIVLRSTVAPGTCDELAKKHKRVIWHAPERLLLGQGMDELDELPQIVGATGQEYILNLLTFTNAFASTFPSFISGTAIEAECAKVSNNIVRYIEFATGTELAEQFNAVGADPKKVREMMTEGYKRGRLAFPSFVGSYCLDKDWHMLAAKSNINPIMATAAAEYNLNLPSKLLYNKCQGKVVAILGLTYKPDLDDCRETPSIRVYKSALTNNAAEIRYHDPLVDVDKTFDELWPDVEKRFTVYDDAADAVRDADVVVIATSHSDYFEGFNFKDGALIIDPAMTIPSSTRSFSWRALA